MFDVMIVDVGDFPCVGRGCEVDLRYHMGSVLGLQGIGCK